MSYQSSKTQINWLIIFVGFLTLVLFWGFSASDAFATSPSNEQCLQCHGDPNLSIKKDGITRSLYVDGDAFQNSVHGFSKCTSCHPGTDSFPHEKTTSLQKAVQDACSTCHSNEVKEYNTSYHATGVATCSDCHDSHYGQKLKDLPVAQQLQNHVETCGQCHQGRVWESYQESFHGKAVSLGGTKVPSCVSCHGAHAVNGPDDPTSPVAKANVPNTCATCHKEPQANMAAGTEHFLLEKEGPGKPMFYTFKFFTWLTIITITLLIIHIELELFRRLRNAKK